VTGPLSRTDRPARGLPAGVEDDRTARMAWSRLCEPADLAAAALVETWGALGALGWVVEHTSPGRGDVGAGAAAADGRSTGSTDDPQVAQGVPARLRRPLQRWAHRLGALDLGADVAALEAVRGRVVVPGDDGWPGALDDLGPAAPMCLWVRGEPDVGALLHGSVALVGARACTEYGSWVAGGIAAEVAEHGRTVVSGGAYGIDAAAHRGALAVRRPTVAFLAGGVDRLYPAGNTRLLESIIASGGAVISEVPPAAVPSKHRFLLRNRLIAAASAATVVVEAARRSGALATAHRASDLLRPLGAVPGPVTSAVSAGCHELIRDGEATCVTGADEVLELVGPLGTGEGRAREAWRDPGLDERRDVSGGPGGLDARVCDALPVRVAADVGSVARAAGLTVLETTAALGRLELLGLAHRADGRWRLAERS